MSTVQHPAPDEIIDPVAPASSRASEPDFPELPVRVIKATRGWIAIDWAEIYQSRELFDTLVMRDVKVRYKQTVLGVAWAVVQPLVSAFVFTMVFSSFRGIKPEGVPYPLFLLAATVPWTFFTNAVSSAGTSLLSQQDLLTKIYFPRLYVPASTVGTYLVDMAIGLALFVVLLPYYGYAPSINLIFLPFVIALTFAAAFGLGLIFASVTILYRDLRFVIPFMLTLLLYASPIFYQQSVLPRRVQYVVAINPVTGIISAYRWSILGLPLELRSLVMSLVATIAVLAFGLFFFRRTERYMADLI